MSCLLVTARDRTMSCYRQQLQQLAATMLRGCESVDRFSRNLVPTLCQFRTSNTARFGFLRSVITTWRTCNILRWGRHLLLGPKVMYGKRIENTQILAG